MVTTEIVEQPDSEPVTVDELKLYFRLNDDSEDALLSSFISAAREQFEYYSGRAVMPTTYRQHFPCLTSPVFLQVGNVTSVESVMFYNPAGDLVELEDYTADTKSTPAAIRFTSIPAMSVTIKPVAYIEYVAGWADANSVPNNVKLAIKGLAIHFYENRNHFDTNDFKAVPMGFKTIAQQYATGINGRWHCKGSWWNPASLWNGVNYGF